MNLYPNNEEPRFASESFHENAWQALREVYGPPEEWASPTRYLARHFLEAVSVLEPSTLSLGTLKAAVDGSMNCGQLHRIAFRFLELSKDSYAAPDREAFLDIVPNLTEASKGHKILLGNEIDSFDDISCYRYCGRTTFVTIHTRDDAMKPVYRRFIRHSSWSSYGKPNQERFDRLFGILDNHIPRRSPPAALTIRTFFRIVDRLDMDEADGKLSACDRRDTIHDLILLYRYCLREKPGVKGDSPISDPRILNLNGAVTFFFDDYVSRETTFVFRPRGRTGAGRLETIGLDNIAVRNTYGQLLLSRTVSPEEYAACRYTLEESLGNHYYEIRSVSDWSEPMLHHQVNFYRKLYEGQKKRTCALSFIKALYLSIDRQTNGAFFRKCFALTYGLLTSRRFVIYCDEDYRFMPFCDYETVSSGMRIVFIVRDFNQMMKEYRKEDYIAVNFSEITDPHYRSLAWQAATSKAGRLYRRSFIFTLRHLLRFLPSLKSRQGWWTPDPNAFTFYDALAVLAFFLQKSEKPAAFNNCMMNVRDFLHWANDNDNLNIDPTVFEILANMKYAHTPTNTEIVSKEQLAAVGGYLAEKAKDNTDYGQALLLLNITLLTPVRITHTCSLLHGEIIYDETINSMVIETSSKGTYGEKGRIIIGEQAARVIAKAQALGKKIGLDCTSDSLRESIFLYKSLGKFHVWTPRRFGGFLEEACRETGVPAFTAKNLRATFMTAAYVAASEGENTNEFVLKLFSYHRRAGTTLEHYVNHDEAFRALRDAMEKGNGWHRTVVPDEIKALQAAIAEIEALLEDGSLPEAARIAMTEKLEEYRRKLDDLKN